MQPIPEIHCYRHGKLSAPSIVCKHLHGPERGFGYYATPNPIPGVRMIFWCEECHAVLEEEGEWTFRLIAFADPLIACTACCKDFVRNHKRLRLESDIVADGTHPDGPTL
jgi:hypothetical protein